MLHILRNIADQMQRWKQTSSRIIFKEATLETDLKHETSRSNNRSTNGSRKFIIFLESLYVVGYNNLNMTKCDVQFCT